MEFHIVIPLYDSEPRLWKLWIKKDEYLPKTEIQREEKAANIFSAEVYMAWCWTCKGSAIVT